MSVRCVCDYHKQLGDDEVCDDIRDVCVMLGNLAIQGKGCVT